MTGLLEAHICYNRADVQRFTFFREKFSICTAGYRLTRLWTFHAVAGVLLGRLAGNSDGEIFWDERLC